jgi:LmbE family N-acetylglucosaminyl deacetylase
LEGVSLEPGGAGRPEGVLVIVAHPDDAEFGCAGTVARWTRAGSRVDYVVCTDGSAGSADPTLGREELGAIREREQRAAAAVLGVAEVTFLRRPDGELRCDDALRRELCRHIRRLRPELVVCQNAVRHYANLGGNHPDHLAAGQAAIECVYPYARNPYSFPELLQEGLTPHEVAEVWVTGTETPDHLVDVSETVELKLRALLCHESQHRQDPSERVRARLAQAGQPAGISLAESFRRVRAF